MWSSCYVHLNRFHWPRSHVCNDRSHDGWYMWTGLLNGGTLSSFCNWGFEDALFRNFCCIQFLCSASFILSTELHWFTLVHFHHQSYWCMYPGSSYTDKYFVYMKVLYLCWSIDYKKIDFKKLFSFSTLWWPSLHCIASLPYKLSNSLLCVFVEFGEYTAYAGASRRGMCPFSCLPWPLAYFDKTRHHCRLACCNRHGVVFQLFTLVSVSKLSS